MRTEDVLLRLLPAAAVIVIYTWFHQLHASGREQLAKGTLHGGLGDLQCFEQEPDHCSPCAVAKFHSLTEASAGLEFERLFTVTTSVSSPLESSSESSDSDVSSSKFRDPATLRSQGCNGLKPTDPTASEPDIRTHLYMKRKSNSTLVCCIF